MNKTFGISLLLISTASATLIAMPVAQPPGGFGPGGPGRGGPGGPGQREEQKLVKQFDQDDNGWLNTAERKMARDAVIADRENGGGEEGGRRGFGGPGRGGPGRGGPGGRGPASEPGKPGPAVSQQDVATYADKPLYDTSVLRTVFIEFENNDWEIELEDFHDTDVDVAAKMTIDGKTYPNVGIKFRGASSYGHVSRGSKRSFNISLDMADKKQNIDGYETLNLLNCHGDPSMMSTVAYSHIARQYLPAPKANFVHVVVNGESWGLYDSVQQFDKKFLSENFNGSKGTRWKVSGSPNGDGGLRYLGDDVDQYKSRFEMKSNDGKKEWAALMELCRVLNETPLDQLESALAPILDIGGTLKFLALDVALVNSDGYWTRASDFNIFRDSSGKFYMMPHDMNEAFAMAGGRGPGGPGRRGPEGDAGRGGPGDSGPPGGRRGGFGGRGPDGPPPEGGFGGRGPDGPQPEGGFGGRGPSGPQPEGGFGGRGPGGPPSEGGFGGRGPGPGGPGGRGPGGGPGHGGVDLDPLIGLDNERMPLRSRLLAVPALKERYMQYVKQIANESLNWQNLGPVVEGYRDLIAPVVKADTRRLSSWEAFEAATSSKDSSADDAPMSLRKFAVERSKFLLSQK